MKIYVTSQYGYPDMFYTSKEEVIKHILDDVECTWEDGNDKIGGTVYVSIWDEKDCYGDGPDFDFDFEEDKNQIKYLTIEGEKVKKEFLKYKE